MRTEKYAYCAMCVHEYTYIPNKKIYNNYSKRLNNIYFVVFIDATKTKKIANSFWRCVPCTLHCIK